MCFPVYDVLTGSVVTRLSGHDACVRDVSWHPYEDNIISSSVRLSWSPLFTGPEFSEVVLVNEVLSVQHFLLAVESSRRTKTFQFFHEGDR